MLHQFVYHGIFNKSHLAYLSTLWGRLASTRDCVCFYFPVRSIKMRKLRKVYQTDDFSKMDFLPYVLYNLLSCFLRAYFLHLKTFILMNFNVQTKLIKFHFLIGLMHLKAGKIIFNHTI